MLTSIGEVECYGNRPKTLREINPQGVKHFHRRICIDCRKPIMDHWFLAFKDAQKRGNYWCHRDGMQFSSGIKHT